MDAYSFIFPTQTTHNINDCIEGEPIERRIQRIMNNNEPISDSSPIIYTQRKDGVEPMYNIRTDRFDLALDMTDSITKQALAKREAFHAKLEQQNQNLNPPGGPAETAK